MSKEIKPISPIDIENSDNPIPTVVIQAVNNLLLKNYRGSRVTILQSEIVDEIISLDGAYTNAMIFDKRMLDFEPLYRQNGWLVKYDKPAYNENYSTRFIFEKK